jgi:hypothetical protein
MIRWISVLIASLWLAAACHASVLKALFVNREGHAVADAKVFLDCRQNFFFSDTNGVVMAYIGSDVADCVLTVTHPDYSARNRLIAMTGPADTTDCTIVMTANGEPEPIGPGPIGNRFGLVVSCCGLVGCRVVPDNGFGSGLLSIIVDNSPECDSSASMMIAMSATEKAVDGLENGYDLGAVERVVFDARSPDSNTVAEFFSLSDVCNQRETACPAIKTILTAEFMRYEIDITRWNREQAVAILGLSIKSADGHPVTVEIRDLRLEFGVSDRVQRR